MQRSATVSTVCAKPKLPLTVTTGGVCGTQER
jgi:hypothetical protein